MKDQKSLTINVDLPTRLVIPETNFSDDFEKVGYLGLKKMLDKNKINYTGFIIFQESQVK